MNIKNRVKSQLPDNVLKELIIRYFEEHNFKLDTNEQFKLTFKRGSLAKNMITFNPLNWKSILTVKVNNSEVDYNWKVDSTFQVVTKQEEKVWESFVSNFHTTIESGVLSNQDTQEALLTNKKSIKGYLLHAVMGAILFGIPSGLLAHYTGMAIIVSIGAASGALGFLYWKIEKEKAR